MEKEVGGASGVGWVGYSFQLVLFAMHMCEVDFYALHFQIHSVYRHIGVCPQFDIQHSNLTAKEVCGSWSAAMFSDVMLLFIASNYLPLLFAAFVVLCPS